MLQGATLRKEHVKQRENRGASAAAVVPEERVYKQTEDGDRLGSRRRASWRLQCKQGADKTRRELKGTLAYAEGFFSSLRSELLKRAMKNENVKDVRLLSANG